jgi:WD40 repeat protein
MKTVFAFLLGLAVLAAPAAAPPPAHVDAFGDPLPEDAVARLGSSRFRCGCLDPADLALSADGGLIAALETDGPPRITLIDPATGRRLRTFAAEAARTVAFAGGKRLVCSCSDSTVRVYDVALGRLVRKFPVPEAETLIVALSRDGGALAVAAAPQLGKAVVDVHDVATGKKRATLAPVHNAKLGLVLSPQGKHLATYGLADQHGDLKAEDVRRLARTVHLWDVAAGNEWKRLVVDGEVRAAAFSPDGKALAVATGSGLHLWDPAAGKRLQSWLAPSWREPRLTFSPDGKRLVMTPHQTAGAPAMWDLQTGRRLRSARSPDGVVTAVGFRAGRVLAVSLHWRALTVWDVLSGKRSGSEAALVAPIHALHVRAGRILAADGTGRLLAWDLSGRAAEKPPNLRDHDDRPRYVWAPVLGMFSPDGGRLAFVGHYYNGPTLYSVRTGEELFSLPHAHQEQVMTPPAFSGDGKLVASAAYEDWAPSVRVHRADEGKQVANLAATCDWIAGVALDPEGKRVAAALMTRGDDDSSAAVVVWRLDTGKQDGRFTQYELKGLDRLWPRCPLAFSPDGSLLAVDNGLGAVHLLDGATGKRKAVIEDGSKSLLPPAFSPDGRSLAVVVGRADEAAVTLWELRSGQKRWEALLPAPPTALAFDPSGRLLITAHADTTALLWDVSGRSRPARVRDARGWDALVGELSSADAKKSFAAQRLLAAAGDRGVAQLARRMRAAPAALSEKEMAALVKALDDDDPDERARAAAALEGQGKAAEAALSAALKGKPSAELKRAGGALLERIRRGNSPQALRAARAVEVLEWVGTAEAKRLLTQLAKGRPGAVLTVEAKAALARL